ncbi:MAG: G1 family glutamic endopeptidase [Candidatus Korobacteraceae bacterium]
MKDEDWLKTQFAFPLVRTNVEGVYTTPPPPDYLDLKTASDATLWQHGLLLQRPKPDAHPAIVAAWNKVSERGFRTIAPHLGPVPDSVRRVKKGPAPSQVTETNWCGCVLQGSGNWRSVTGSLRLPYLSIPPQGFQGSNGPASLSAWVGLDGFGPTSSQLFQAVMFFYLDTTTNPPSATFHSPSLWWLVPDPNMPGASQIFLSTAITNPPGMKSGDLVQIYCGYVTALDGSIWGSAYFLFLNDLELTVIPEPEESKGRDLGRYCGPYQVGETPIFMNFFVPGPPGISGQGGSIEWIMENESVTGGYLDTIMPVFSASENSIAPVTFTQAMGYGQSEGVTGDPANGFTVVWVSNVASVALAPETVSITYT